MLTKVLLSVLAAPALAETVTKLDAITANKLIFGNLMKEDAPAIVLQVAKKYAYDSKDRLEKMHFAFASGEKKDAPIIAAVEIDFENLEDVELKEEDSDYDKKDKMSRVHEKALLEKLPHKTADDYPRFLMIKNGKIMSDMKVNFEENNYDENSQEPDSENMGAGMGEDGEGGDVDSDAPPPPAPEKKDEEPLEVMTWLTEHGYTSSVPVPVELADMEEVLDAFAAGKDEKAWKAAIEKAEQVAEDQAPGKESTKAELYVAVLKRALKAGSPEKYVEKEMARLDKIAASGGVTERKKSEMKTKLNCLKKLNQRISVPTEEKPVEQRADL